VRYFRNELGYKSDLKYQGPFGGGYPPPTSFRGDWMSVRWNRPAADAASGTPARHGASAGPTPSPAATSSPPPAPPDQPLKQALMQAMTTNHKMKVLVACGYYDLVCNYAANTYLAAHLDDEISRNVTARAYTGGHALYTDPTAQRDFKRDVTKFIEDALSTESSSSSPKTGEVRN